MHIGTAARDVDERLHGATAGQGEGEDDGGSCSLLTEHVDLLRGDATFEP